MKKIILILLCLLPFIYNAQPQNKLVNIDINVTYHADYVKNAVDINKRRSDRMILKIGEQSSEFYSLLSDRRRVIQDSMLSKGFSSADIEKEKAKIPRSTQHYRVLILVIANKEIYHRVYPNNPILFPLTSKENQYQQE